VEKLHAPAALARGKAIHSKCIRRRRRGENVEEKRERKLEKR
jgi:hypothetical protein